MQREPYPVPVTMKIRDLEQDDIEIQCPECWGMKFMTGYNLSLQLPAESLVIAYVTRHVCQKCSRPGRKVRCIGFVKPYPRSGAEPRQDDLIPF